MRRAKNGNRYSSKEKKAACKLRKEGKTHREIASVMGISVGTASLWTKGVHISTIQKNAIEKRRSKHIWSNEDRRLVSIRLRPFQFARQYTDDALLQKIRDFYHEHGRIPLKREFNAWDVYAQRFGSWNMAITQAGFETNPILFAKKFVANDGHRCDSFTEKVIDDWLYIKRILHTRNVTYGKTKLTADFKINPNIFMEFFGLAGVQSKYDANIQRKRLLSKKFGYRLIEVYPQDIYPVNRLDSILKKLVCF